MNAADTKHVFVGLSGGVDSAVAALLLQRRGYRVTALFMKNWEEDDDRDYCAAAEDYRIASGVCERLEIPLLGINFSAEYWDLVFSRFLSELAAGRTPNPDVLCNREIKFRAFLDYARAKGADLIATGHYARVAHADGRYQLLKGCDTNKDQSYFLYTLGQRELARIEFPLGGLEKLQVRTLARQAGLPNYARKDSTGICFIGERPFKAFLHRYLPRRPGEIRALTGETKGEHDGVMYYTIGQRHGLSIGGRGEPWFVADKDPARNILYVVQGHNHPALFSTALGADSVHWVAGSAPALPLACRAKIRYRQTEAACLIERGPADTLQLTFSHAQRAVTAGQSVVFYRGDACLGGGIITRAFRHKAALGVSSARTAEPAAQF
ncbi:MAG: tRNA 2-thiouridine(34) synthase MnmA [Acidiferrobacterales bacterium]